MYKIRKQNFFILLLLAVIVGMVLGYSWDIGQVAGL